MYKVDFFFKSLLVVLNGIIKVISQKGNFIHIWIDKADLDLFLGYIINSSYFKMDQLIDLFCIDYLNKDSDFRFELIYNLVSFYYNYRISIRVFLFLYDTIKSVNSFFNSSNWLEREIWDMYGVFFFEHNDLRRILTDYGFLGHPLRKDFPLQGFIELSFDDYFKIIKLDFVELTQDYRVFSLKDLVW